ncbi:Heat stress transcription factor B-1 [Triticum urartu]|uniref:Heat stress transcription factor B-1 n=1 Tax=Triticum urartu TaxID=4572 RepID=M7YQN6_TRIUA|nr:Heat stress transcription factor B-1 [Triticum urartu]
MAGAAAQQQQQKGGGAVRVGGGGPAPFLTKTHQMVEERGTDEVISWGEQGRSFVVWKPVELARDLLPLHFKHCNFSSFVRQLNTYGFRKVVPDRWEFANENFRRGEQGLLSGIRRRKATATTTTPQSSKTSGTGVNVAFPPPLPALRPASASTSGTGNDHSSSSASSPTRPDLSSENEQLRKDNHALAAELALARRHCEGTLGSTVVGRLEDGALLLVVDQITHIKAVFLLLFARHTLHIGSEELRLCDTWNIGEAQAVFLLLFAGHKLHIGSEEFRLCNALNIGEAQVGPRLAEPPSHKVVLAGGELRRVISVEPRLLLVA